jgi:hypothetical protein
MTLTLELSPQTEERLKQRAAIEGIPLPEFVAGIVEEAARAETRPSDMVDHLRSIGVIGAVKGNPRPDGLPWSEIEAAAGDT